jgi:predicted ATPase
MAKLNRITLKGFKSIREMDLPLGSLNVLIGANGVGKSNLLSFFRLLNALGEQNLQLFVGKQGGANALLHHGRKRTPQLEAKMYFDIASGKNTYAMTLIGVAPDDLMFADEEVTFEPTKAKPKQTVLGGGHRESRLPETVDSGNKTAQPVKWSLDRWRVYHFHDTSEEAPIKQKCSVKDNRLLRTDGANLAAFLYMLRTAHPTRYARIRDTVRMAAPFFDDFVLEPDALNPSYIDLEWRERGWDTPFFAHNLSDGTLRFIALATVLLQPPDLPTMPHTILIDEPELGLHPYAITLLADMMRAASVSAQLIVSTQSITLLDELAEPAEVVVVEREKGQSTFRRLEPEKLEGWLEEYSLGELWEKNVLGGRPSP